MKYILILFTSMLLIFVNSSFGQLRYGSCKSAPENRFYLTPHVGIGSAKLKTDSLTQKSFTWLAGITAHYRFENFKLGLGVRYQDYTKPELTFIKPYLAVEVPLYFSEFEDFGFHIQAGPSFGQQETPKIDGVFGDLGLYFNKVVSPSSALYFALEYSYNNLNYEWGMAQKTMNISEFKFIFGYRFWF